MGMRKSGLSLPLALALGGWTSLLLLCNDPLCSTQVHLWAADADGASPVQAQSQVLWHELLSMRGKYLLMPQQAFHPVLGRQFCVT